MTPRLFFPSIPDIFLGVLSSVTVTDQRYTNRHGGGRREAAALSSSPQETKTVAAALGSALCITRLLLHAATCPLSPANLLDIDAIKKGHSRSG